MKLVKSKAPVTTEMISCYMISPIRPFSAINLM